MQKNMKRRGLSFLLILAMLFVSIAVMLPVATSADGEFTDPGVQQLESLDLANDDETTLRFLFKIGKLDYEEVGFVFSKSNATPTIGGAGCLKKEVTAVYSSINAGGDPVEAGPGLFWVAIKMTDIPHEYFDGALYARPYVIDEVSTRYADVLSTTVCSAAGHVHTIDEFNHERTGGTAALDVVGTIVGKCPGCNLEVTFNNVNSEIEPQKWTAGEASERRWFDRRQVSDILAGGKHFYPDESNGGAGNDLIIEYSVLWNETLLNLSPSYNEGARIETRFDTDDGGTGKGRSIAYWSLTNDVADSGANYAGAFEYACGQIQTSEAGNPYPGMTAGGGAYSAYPNVGGTDRAHPEWGWHRIGIVYHEDVTNLDQVIAGTQSAKYKLTVTIYVDGQVVSILSGTDLKNETDYKLYTATHDAETGVHYDDMASNVYVFAFLVRYAKAPSADAYFADGDVFVTAGHDFVHPVQKVANPAARTETILGQNLNGAFYYTSAGSHDHVWGELVDDASHAADCGHAATQSIHCTICGAVKPDSTVDLPLDPNAHTYGDWVLITEPTLFADGLERRTCSVCSGVDERVLTFAPTVYDSGNAQNNSFGIRKNVNSALDGDHFYPADSNGQEGRDLYFETDILWNETITSGWIDGNGFRIQLVYKTDVNKRDNLFLLAPKNNKWGSSDAKASGGFDYGWAATHAIVYGPMGVNGAGSNAENFPNIGAYGWHRIGVRLHEEAAVSGNGVAYTFYSTLYIDGAKVWQIRYTGDFSSWISKSIMLFTATNEGGNLVYSDGNSNLNLEFNGWDIASVDGVYVPYCNVRIRAVDVDFNPSSEIEPAGSPINAAIDLGSYDPAVVHYQFAD